MIKLTINGQKVSAEENTTILNAALKTAYTYRTFVMTETECYGGCRLCVVEVEGREDC